MSSMLTRSFATFAPLLARFNGSNTAPEEHADTSDDLNDHEEDVTLTEQDAVGDDPDGVRSGDAVDGLSGDDTLIVGATVVPFDDADDVLLDDAGLDGPFLLEGAPEIDADTGGLEADSSINGVGEAGAVTITDFDPAEDVLMIEVDDEGDVAVVGQTVLAQGVLVTFTNGSTAFLQGLTEEVPASSILFVETDEESGDDAEVDDGAAAIDAPELDSLFGTEDEEIYSGAAPDQDADVDLIVGEDADMREDGQADDGLLSTPAGPMDTADTDIDWDDAGAEDDSLVICEADAFGLGVDLTDVVTVTDFDISEDMLIVESEMPADVIIIGQVVMADGVLVRLSTGATILLQGLDAPIDPALLRAELPERLTAT